jgi:hypothetical protein
LLSLLAGWVGGISCLLVFFAITLWSSLLLTECHETEGMKHPTYRSAVLHILGECRQQHSPHFTLQQLTLPVCTRHFRGSYVAHLLCMPQLQLLCCTHLLLAAGPGNAFVLTSFQYLNLILSSIGYTVAAGHSLR